MRFKSSVLFPGWVILYYGVLLLLLVSWNVQELPPTIVRICFLFGVFFPVILERSRLLPVITLFVIVGLNGVGFSYMPYEQQSYVFIVLAVLLFGKTKEPGVNRNFLAISVLAVLVLCVDVFTWNGVGKMGFSILVTLMLLAKIPSDSETLTYIFPLTIVLAAFVLEIMFLLNASDYQKQLSLGEELYRYGWLDPNYFSSTIGLGMMVSLSAILLKLYRGPMTLVLMILVIVMGLGVVLMCASRGTVSALAMGVVLLVLLSRRSSIIKSAILVSIVLLVFILYKNGYLGTLLFRFGESDGMNGRSEIWGRRLEQFWNEGNTLNYLFGYGAMEGFQLGFGYGKSFGSHNDFVSVLVNYGLFGLLLFCSLLLHPIKIMIGKNRGVVVALSIFLIITISSLEPFSLGYFAYYFFYLYIYSLAIVSRSNP